MNLVFVPYRSTGEWCAELFPEYSLAMLPVGGRPFVEHQLDRAAEIGAEKVLVLDYEFDTRLAERLTGGERRRWPFELVYVGAGIFGSEAEVKKRYAAFLGDAPCKVIFGPLFPYGDDWLEIDSLRAYYDVNFRVLTEPDTCTAAGYSSEPGVYLGMNVSIKTGREIARPVCIGDDVRIEYGCLLGGNVIVGDDSIIDAGTELRDTIVFPATYVGRKMEFRRKIVAGSRVVDVDTGVYADIDEAGLSGGLDRFTDIGICFFWEYFLAFSLALVFSPFYLLWLPFKPFLGQRLWAYKLSADRYPKLLKVLVGRARLVRLHKEDEPCVFRPSEARTADCGVEQERIDNAFYHYNRTIRRVTGIVLSALVYRLFVKANEQPR